MSDFVSQRAYQRGAAGRSENQNKDHSGSNHGRLFAMIGTSTALMFGLMYLNSYSIEYLLDYIDRNGEVDDWPLGKSGEPAAVEGLRQAISTPVIAGIRPEPMNAEKIRRRLGTDPVCTYIRAVDADPILATDGNGKGIANISESLVVFTAESSVTDGGRIVADGGRILALPRHGLSPALSNRPHRTQDDRGRVRPLCPNETSVTRPAPGSPTRPVRSRPGS